MTDRQETSDDIIAEMRGARTEFPFVYLMGEPDTPEVVDFKTKEIIEPRKINIRRVTVKELADRFEAALKRERGNFAQLREAMVEILEYIESFHKYIIPGKREKMTTVFAVADTIRNKARAALAEPPRNCDKFNTGDPMKDAEDAYGAWLRHCDDPTIPPSCKVESAFKNWLFAPLTMQR